MVIPPIIQSFPLWRHSVIDLHRNGTSRDKFKSNHRYRSWQTFIGGMEFHEGKVLVVWQHITTSRIYIKLSFVFAKLSSWPPIKVLSSISPIPFLSSFGALFCKTFMTLWWHVSGMMQKFLVHTTKVFVHLSAYLIGTSRSFGMALRGNVWNL